MSEELRPGRLTLVVILTVRPGALDAFRAYEAAAAAIMRRHGGAIERAVVVKPTEAAGAWREIHLVTFPDEAAFARYRADPALAALAAARQACIAQTELFVGEEGPRYGG